MDVYVIPVGRDRYELYFEGQSDADVAEMDDADAAPGFFARFARKFPLIGRLKDRFTDMLRAAEDRRHRPDASEPDGWAARMQHRMMAWVAERIAEQRLLWHLRGQTSVVLVHPPDVTFDDVRAIVRRTLQRDYDRHLRWLLIDGVLMTVSAVLTIVPGPNLVAYYFVFRVVGHWLSVRGARQGLKVVTFSGRASQPLTELRDVTTLEPNLRAQRISDVAHQLRLQHLTTFYSRLAA